MVYTSVIEGIDRLAVKSILRGSTATIAGVLATLGLIVLCMFIYIPPARSILAGNYFQTQFLTQTPATQKFYADTDFKIAITYRNKVNNSVANHTKILEYAYSLMGEQFPYSWQNYLQPMETCSENPQYFKNIPNAKTPQDCFIFPKNGLFNIYKKYGSYSYLYYNLFAIDDPNPFSSAGNKLSGYQSKLQNLLQNYYYQVYFTSKIINKQGTSQFALHRFYSTQVEPTSEVTTSWNELIYNIRNTTLDISIMPWLNYQTRSHLIWLGQMYNFYLLNDDTAARGGVYVDFIFYLYQIRSFRYYKKIDFLVGVIGGAMLLFYILLWIPFNYINKTIHQIRNTQNLLLLSKANNQDPIMQEDLIPAKVSWKYWISNPVLNYFFPSFKEAQKIVNQAEMELDVVTLIKKLKVTQRNLKKKNLQTNFTPKALQLKFKGDSQTAAKQGQNSINLSQTSSIMPIETQLEEQDFEEDQYNNIFKLKIDQINFLREQEPPQRIYPTNFTAMALRKDENSIKYKELQSKNKWSARFDQKNKPTKKRRIFNAACEIIQKFDFFGAKVNLNAGTSSSSVVGCCGILLIIFLSCLTVGLTVSNISVPQFMIYRKFEQEQNFGYNFKLGTDIRLAVCTYSVKKFLGSNRSANFRFYYENAKGRTYFSPIQMTTADYALFGISASSSPVDITYCMKMASDQSIFLGNRPNEEGYFGYRIQPYCTSTPAFCTNNAATINFNYLNLLNSQYIPLFLTENKFDPDTKTFIPNLLRQSLNLDVFYLDNKTAMEQTLFLDHVRIEDDTTNYFMRKAPVINAQGLAKNVNTPYPISRIFNSTKLYYELKIKLSSRQTNYVISTPKADTILGIIGGVIVIWYSICHWLGKVYNSYQVRAVQAQTIYKQQSVQANILMKLLAVSAIPLCLIPRFYDIRNTISRMRQVDKKILNDLNYLWLIKYVDTIFQLSSTLFKRIQAQNLSKVYLKQKIDQSNKVINQAEQVFFNQNFFDDDYPFEETEDKYQASMTLSNKISNISRISKNESFTDKKLNEIQIDREIVKNEKTEKFSENYLQGHPKPLRFGWLDTFEYHSSLTFKGKRQVTSTFGGCCCLILLMFILIVVNFELGIYLTRSDMKIGMTTSMMQPLQTEASNKILFQTGTNFKLGLTFSKNYQDYPHQVSQYLTKGLGISIFQKEVIKRNGNMSSKITQYPMVPCTRGYFSGSLSALVNPAYFANQQLGYCVPDGLLLEISGLPQDTTRRSFTLSIYNKLNSTAGKQNIKLFLQNFYPKFHMTSPYPDTQNQKIRYQIGSFLLDPRNITEPIQQNISISKLTISDDRQIDFNQNPDYSTTYTIHPFQQMEAQYTGLPTEDMYYNLTFSNSYQVDHYSIQGDKFYQTFGIVGGIIAFFIFGFGFIPRSFNQYRMKYLIGRELYLFEMSKKKKDSNKNRGKLKKTKQQIKYLRQINDYKQDKVLRAYFFSYIGAFRQNYNIDPVLRRVTILQQKVEKDLCLFQVYKKVHRFRDSLNQQYKTRQDLTLNIADIYLMHIYNDDPQQAYVDGINKLKGYVKKYKWTAYEQQAIIQALKAHISLREVFDNAFLQQNFDIDQNASRANLSNINPSLNSLSESMGQSQIMSHAQDD